MSEAAYTREPSEPSEPARPVPPEHVHETVDHHARAFEVERTSTTPVRTMAAGRGLLRALLVLIGVAGMVGSAFLEWIHRTDGVRLSDRAFFTTTFGTTSRFVISAGFAAIVIGLVALLGLASINGWPTRLGGVLGIAAFILVVISIGRSTGFSVPQDIGQGLWLLLAGSLVCTVAGFVPATRIVERRDVTAATA